MKNDFRKALKIFWYLAILFTLVYWIWMIYQDYFFIETYGLRLGYIGLWLAYYLMYFLCLALCFWVPVSIFISTLFFYKIIKRGIANSPKKPVD